ncbi:MAG TPA: hypothetical protein VFS20_20675 [Longimicrobium sp.]|nr:hypothetical protein [Longimicrobium sp.]
MKRVIERCPNCGVEHDDPQGGDCEVCGTRLRFWCRAHSREIGWLDSAQCPRCAAESATWVPRVPTPPPSAAPRPTPPPARPAPPREPPRMPPREPAPPPPREPAPAPRSPWLDRVRTRRAPPPPPPEWTPEPAPPPYRGPDPGEVLRERMREVGPEVVKGGVSLAWRLIRGLVAVIRNVFGWGVIGALLATAVGYYENADMLWFAAFGAMVGGGVGLFFGLISALRILFASQRRRVPRGR